MSQDWGLILFIAMYGFVLGECLVQKIRSFLRSEDTETETTESSDKKMTPLLNETTNKDTFRGHEFSDGRLTSSAPNKNA
ncbi:MAG: hypothetical protein ACFFDT_36195 [Candidatus Hodarchaeota archaeon]